MKVKIKYFKYTEPQQNINYAEYADCDYDYAECTIDYIKPDQFALANILKSICA